MELTTDTGGVSSAPIEAPEATTFGGDQEGLEEAAAELARRREARAQERPEAEPEELDDDPEVTMAGRA
jgi:hypothetical protein